MLPIIILLFISFVNTQYYYPQQSYPFNNYNPWSSYSQNYLNRPTVRGNLLSDDISTIPYGSRITVSLTDVSLQDAPSRPLNTITLYGSYRFPIAFEIPYSIAQVQANGNNIQQYTIQARIEKDGQLLYINDQYTPVQLIPAPINPINVVMKNTGNNGGGMFTTRPPVTNNYVCQLRPESGLCYASIQQYYFNSQLGVCQTFIWGGCGDGANQNRFSSRNECERTCLTYQRRNINNNSKQKWMG